MTTYTDHLQSVSSAEVTTSGNALVAVRRLVGALRDWRPAVLVAVFVGLTVLMLQLPLFYTIIVGKERGGQSDLPYLINVKAAEAADDVGRWRWLEADAELVVPGVGQRPLLLGMRIISHRAQWEPAHSPTMLTLRAGDTAPITVPLRTEGAQYHFYIPAAATADGNLRVQMQTAPWQHPTDAREDLGIAVGEALTVQSIRGGGLTRPASGMLLAWSVGLLLCWLTVRVVNVPRGTAFWLLLPLAVVLALLAPVMVPRIAMGNLWILQAGVLAVGAAVVCVLTIPPLLRALRLPAPPDVLPWLLLLVVMTFTIAYSARLYPASMPGDLQLHVNRYLRTVFGEVYILAQHRGLPFPFPNGMYVLMAPLHVVTGESIHALFELVGGMMETTTVLLMYLLAARLWHNAKLALCAAAVAMLTAGGFMVTWFAFQTQIAAQWFTLLLVTLLAFVYPQRRTALNWMLVFTLLVAVFLAHIGQFINLGLVGLLLVPVLWWRARSPDDRAAARWVGSTGLAAGLFVVLFYYSAFLGVLWDDVVGVFTGGLNDVTGRDPIPLDVTLWATWEGGLITHFGFFPVLLALVAALLPWGTRVRDSIVPVLVWLTFAVSISQGIVPLITQSSITTRWLMFAAWAIALMGGRGLWLLWQRGRGGQVAVVAMLGYVAWVMLVVWMNAMTLRLPPIEPF